MSRLAVQSDVAARCTPLPVRKPSPFRGRWLWATIGVALLCALFLTLGFWQLQRLGQKRAANALILARMQEPPLTLSGQTLDPEQANLRRADGARDVRLQPGDRPAQPHPQRNPRRACHRPAPHRGDRTPPCSWTAAGSPTRWRIRSQRKEFQRCRGRGRVQRHPPPQPGAQQAAFPPPTRRSAPTGRGWTPGTASTSRASRSRSLIRCCRCTWRKIRRPVNPSGAFPAPRRNSR